MKKIGMIMISIGVVLGAIFLLPVAYDYFFVRFKDIFAGGSKELAITYIAIVAGLLVGIGYLVVNKE